MRIGPACRRDSGGKQIGLGEVGKVCGHDGDFTVGSGGPGQLTGKLKARLTAIQRGEAPDPHGWVVRV